jgi:hypothetical protein
MLQYLKVGTVIINEVILDLESNIPYFNWNLKNNQSWKSIFFLYLLLSLVYLYLNIGNIAFLRNKNIVNY